MEVIRYVDIWSHLKNEWGASFSEATERAHMPSETVELRDCGECQLQYFFPVRPGSDQFYSELTASVASYYNDEKWEFEFVRSLLKPGDKVLDVACGSGAFLASIKGTVQAAMGVETNPHAVEAAQKRDVLVEDISIQEFSTKHEGAFQIVTVFQVAEHLDFCLFVCEFRVSLHNAGWNPCYFRAK